MDAFLDAGMSQRHESNEARHLRTSSREDVLSARAEAKAAKLYDEQGKAKGGGTGANRYRGPCDNSPSDDPTGLQGHVETSWRPGGK